MRFANMIPFVPSETLLRERDVAERPGDVRLRRPERSGDIRTVRARQGSNMRKRGGIHQISPLFHILLKARGVAERPGDVRLRRPERSVDIRTVQTRQGSNTQETCCPLDDPFILVTYPHFICIANSFSTKKEDTHTGYPQKASTRRDSNPRPSPWQGDTPPLSHSCIGNIPSKPHIELHRPLNLHLTFLDKPSTD